MDLRLKTQYTLLIVGLILSVVSVLAVASLYHHRKSIVELTDSSSNVMAAGIRQQIQKRAEAYARFLADNLVNPLYQYDMDQIGEILSGIKMQANVTHARVYDTDCKVVHDGTEEIATFGTLLSNPDLCRGIRNKGRLVSQTEDDLLSVGCPIWIGETPLGGVDVGLSLYDINMNLDLIDKRLNEIGETKLYQYIIDLILITGVLVIFGCLMSILISTRIVRPIKHMTQCARRIGSGDYDFEIEPRYRDEVGNLLSAFDKMRNDLQVSTVSVEELRREIKERNKAEEERRKVERQLQRAQKLEVVGRLASGVAHDLNNILSGIVSYPDLLLMDLPKESPLRNPIETIQRSGFKAAAIVQDLLTLSRRGVTASEIVNLNKIANEYLDSLEFNNMTSYYSDVRIEKQSDDNLMNIKGSAVHLSKTVMNLVTNAIEAMPKGGMVKIKLQNQYIDQSFLGYDEINEGEYVVLSVTDDGMGISETDIEHIFEPFYTKKVMGRSGTGLGMAVVWGTVKDHDGYIDVKSAVNQGTTVTLYLPATREDSDESKEQVIWETIKGHGEKILVIDDSADQREIAAGMLTRLGYQVSTVSGGEKAVEHLQEHFADLILLDMIMPPGIDGLETYERILKIQPGQKAIIASGYSETDRVRKAQKLGAGPYLRKPYTIEELGSYLHKELEKK